MKLPRLYVIIDRGCAEQRGCGDVIEACTAAANAGARFFQIREKALPDAELWTLAEQLSTRLAGYRATVIVNGRADIALALGCDGVHRPQSGLPIRALRRLVEYRLVGASTHDATELLEANDDHADFLTFGPVFETTSKPNATPKGTTALAAASKLVDCPVYALGGVTPSNVRDCLHHGAHGVAVLSGIMAADDPFEATQAYLRAIERWENS